ncbi:MAG: Fe2+-dicitrate sensor, membrane component [Gammaproteobacteria bacterium]|nr:MAG: Fe2+-dicitrate sensor, membrane component [Gammaproteobacteria bacterium]
MISGNNNTINREVARAAAQWLMRLHDDAVSNEDIQLCEQWRQAHSDHEQAWQRAHSIQEKLGLLPVSTGMVTLNRKVRADRRHAMKTLAVLITAGPASYLGYNSSIRQAWSADYSTAKGELQRIELADGSVIHLNTNTIVDVIFDAHQRKLVLHQGELLVETGKDTLFASQLIRPFSVHTHQGEFRPIGTRFIVRNIDGNISTDLMVLEGKVKATTHLHSKLPIINAGQQLTIYNDRHSDIRPVEDYADAWSRGLLYARNMRLDHFLNEISRYRSGVLRCDPAIANLHISGSFQLKDSDKILQALPQTLPISLHFLTPYWVTVKEKTT